MSGQAGFQHNAPPRARLSPSIQPMSPSGDAEVTIKISLRG
ncbi:MAG: hypothetical protein ACUVS2_05475 [Candidatus Flexifilum sp.]